MSIALRTLEVRRAGLLAAATVAVTAVVAGCAGSPPSQVVVGSGGASRPAPSSASVATATCPVIAGLPNTENGIFDLTARGTTCATAATLGTAALHTHKGAAFSAAGFACSSRYDTNGYPSYRYACTSGAQRVTFVYSS